MVLQTFGGGQGYLKAGLLGFPKSGKTFTAALLACEVHRRFKLKGPVALFDTEGGGEYVAGMITKATGTAPVGMKSRALVDLLTVARECEKGAAAILIADSVTHVWREVCAAYLKQVNAAREAPGTSARSRLEFQDWAAIKDRWAAWTDLYLNSRLHIIICGRAGYEWDFEEHEDAAGNTRKELVKTGVKMKVESEFGFEPSLLIEMERMQVPAADSADKFRFVHRARVLGDRFNAMDGAVQDNPTAAWFSPHLDRLTAGVSNVVDVEAKTPMGVDEAGDAEWQREKRQRVILCERIQGAIVQVYPGQSAAEKKAKVSVLGKCFGTTSWTEVENMNAGKLAAGLEVLETELKKAPALPVKAEKKEE